MIACMGILFTVAIILTVIYVKWRYTYWKRRNVPQLSPSLPFGDMENPLARKHGVGELIAVFYRKFKESGEKHAGVYVFASPNYLPIDPELIKNIMRKDFQHFVDRGFYYNEKDDPLSANLFSIGGQKWKNLRAKLTPTFTSGKMKMMFDTLVECTHPMEELMASYFVNKETIDIGDVFSRFTADVITSCAFGLECNNFKGDDTKFRAHGKNILAPRSKATTLQVLFAAALPKLANKLGIIFIPKESSAFFFDVVKDTIKYRRENGVQRKDMLQILMELQESNVNALTIQEIAAQALMFFLAGFETSSSTMKFCLYELATNADIQEKVRDEINQVLKQHGGKLTYNAITEMKYMAQVIDETLRKYPPLTFITRKCIKDYVEPSSGVTIEKGTKVHIPVLGLHMDPEYFPDPEKFDPERFSEENKHRIVPFTYIPFGEGPRHCVGMRFGMMQTKVALTCLLRTYLFTVSPETQIPLKWSKYSLLLTTENTIWLNIDRVC
ncbi:probable cytochrome P450 6a13 [Photinus pyralis]|nr:probable cytochrome P450 6a13 isoform X1 [Photinus pyralis]XP_031353128.1 probable cytochrome P450 6a13 isoform X1 [Photinus pyralis]XP_031355287.1 probable cytochrome P450 6a13 [Photinus pyralis]